LTTAFRVLTGRQMAGRGATIFPDDIYLTSYPRSGNTWVRFLIANLLHPEEPTTFENIESRVAEIYFNPDHKLRRLPRPRILKSHEPFQPNYPYVIYIVRDPRDLAISFFHHHVKWRNIPESYSMDAFIPRFMSAEFDPASGSWVDNVMSWIAMRQGKSNFLLLRFEDLQENTRRELLRIAGFLEAAGVPNIDRSAKAVARAITLSTPERMRCLEKQQARNYPQLKQTRLDKPFVRNARVGDWRTSLSDRSVSLIEHAWRDVMQDLGYEPSASVREWEIMQVQKA
jgi:Sulfotransferase domain